MNIKTATSTTTTTTTTTALQPESGRKNRDTSSVAAPTRTGTSYISTAFDGYTNTTAINSVLGAGTSTKMTALETYTSILYKNYSFIDKGPRDLLTTKGGVGGGVAAVRSVRDAEEEDVDSDAKCRPFVEGEENTFYSPNYPSHYPKNINCTRIIEGECLNRKINCCSINVCITI